MCVILALLPWLCPHVDLSVGTVPPFTVGPYESDAPWVDVDARWSDEVVEVTAVGGVVDSLSFTSDGRGVHARLRAAFPRVEALGEVHVTFRGGATATASFRTDASGRIVLPSGKTTGPDGFYSGPAPLPQVVLLNTDGRLHIGWRPEGPTRTPGEPICARWDIVWFEAWVDDDYLPRGAPTASVEGGVVRVDWLKDWRHGRHTRLSYDPHGPGARLAAGRHPLTVRWPVRFAGGNDELVASVAAVVADDGTVCIRPP